MPRKIGSICVSAGVVLVLAALLLFLYNRYEDERAGQKSDRMLADVQAVIAERNTKSAESTEEDPIEETVQETQEEMENTSEKVVEIAGYKYIGYLTIPTLKLELPVIDDWSYEKLKTAPCRHTGTAQSDDLVIAAHNYKRHFGLLSQMDPGDTVLFTEMDGTVNSYALVKVETLNPTDADAAINSEHDLVLYTCTFGGATRVVAFFDRVSEEIQNE